MPDLDRERLRTLTEAELRAFAGARPRSKALSERAQGALVGGVPMPWMMRWAGAFPVFCAAARGARVTDVDGHEYVDFCLGDTGAMPGHGPSAVVTAVVEQLGRGITTMLPTEDAIWVGEELTRRFGLARWMFTLTATDANRAALRLAREITGRPRVLVYSYCYHGSVDEAFAVADGHGGTRSRAGNVGPAVDPAATETAMTNMGIVLPDDGYLDGLRALTRETGTLLIIDETHCLSAGPGGCTAAWGLEPDLLTAGKALAGGVPVGVLGLSDATVEAMFARPDADYEDTGGVGGTLAGNPLSAAAMRATLGAVLAEEAYAHTIPLATRFAGGVREVVARHGAPWHVTQLGCRAEYAFTPAPPRNGTQAHAAADHDLERFLHLHALNRGVLLTPFHNMALMSPATTAADVDRHTEVFDEAVSSLAS